MSCGPANRYQAFALVPLNRWLERLPEDVGSRAVVVHGVGTPRTPQDRVEVLVRSSFAAHLADWLLLTAPEHAARPQEPGPGLPGRP